jgi:hypothetical protein
VLFIANSCGLSRGLLGRIDDRSHRGRSMATNTRLDDGLLIRKTV